MARVLVEKGVKGKDELTRRQSALISNANLAKRLDDVLPEHSVRALCLLTHATLRKEGSSAGVPLA